MAACSAFVVPAGAQSALSGSPITIARAAGRITIDGDLSDDGWRNATKVEKWYETNPGDNTEPKVRNVGYLTYDDTVLLRGLRVRRSRSGRAARPVCRSRQRAVVHRLWRRDSRHAQRRQDRPSSWSRTRTTSSTTRSATMRPVRIRRPISSGNRRRKSPRGAGRSRCECRSRRCGTGTSIRSRGGSCCTATIRAASATSSSRRSCRAAATASSAERTRCSVSSICPLAATSSSRPT